MSTDSLPVEQTETPPPQERAPRPRRGRRGARTFVIVTAVVVAAGVTYIVVDPFATDPKDSSFSSSAPTGLAKVSKGTLAARTLENGTLGFAGEFDVVNKVSGTVTKIPAVGQIVSQGKSLYKVDGKPVVFLYGATIPAYRSLSWGMEGADVRQLNADLVALGYADKDDLDPDSDYFGRQTYYAVEKLQDEVGLEETGTLSLGQAVFLPAKELRITKVSALRGGSAQSGSSLLQASSTEREITVNLNANQQSTVKAGDKVTITLPTGRSTPGVVSSVGKVATKGDDSTTVKVLIKPSKPKETGTLDQAPVQVSIVTQTVKDVLSVPVNALLALAGGGYAVEVVENGVHRLVAVSVGLFDTGAGTVEVSGELSPEQDVVVPTS